MTALRTAWQQTRRFPWLTMALVAWGITTIGAGVAQADTGVVGFGDLLPKIAVPAGSSPTLFEGTNGLNWMLDSDPAIGFDQVIVSTMNSVVNVIWGLVLLLTQSALYLGQWILSMLNIPGVNDWLSQGLGTSATALMSWLAPSAIVIGALVAYVQHRGGEGLDQVFWVLVAATLGMSLALSPAVWVNGTQNLRTIGTDAVLTLASPAAGPDQSKPFAWPASDYAGANARDSMIRKSNDATFRGLVVYPWCIAEFGSIAACGKYGADMIKAGTDPAARKKQIATVSKMEGGDDKPASRWLKGYNWPERLAIAIASLLVTLIFCGVLLVLAFAAIGAFISTIFHLMLGALFALTWCIPGRPRQIGLRWFESLIGTVIQGIIAVGTYGAALTVLTLIYSQIDALGGVLVVTALAITVVITALAFRSQVSSWFGVVAGGRAGAALLGAAAMRVVTRGRSGGGASRPSKSGNGSAPRDAGAGGGSGGPRRDAPPAPNAPPRRRPISGPNASHTAPPLRPIHTAPAPTGGTGQGRPAPTNTPARRPGDSSSRRPAPSAPKRPTSSASSQPNPRRPDAGSRGSHHSRPGAGGQVPPPAHRPTTRPKAN